MTDDNAHRRLMGLPPFPGTGLQGSLSAVAQALGGRLPTPRRQSQTEALETLSRPASPPWGLGALAQARGSTEPSMTGTAPFTGVPTTRAPRMTNPFVDYGIPMKSDRHPSMANALNLFAPSPTSRSYLDGLAPKVPPLRNALTGYGIPVNSTPSPAALPDTRRKTFFSFHFDDSFRVNQVRKSGLIRPKQVGRLPVWWRDSSLYEKSKRSDDASLRLLILSGLSSTSVTCVLAGEQTWQREWVRFEIASSVKRGNALLTVYIHNLKCPNNGYGRPGPNPMDHMGVFIADDGRTYLAQRDARGDWVRYDKITTPVIWPKYLPKITLRNRVQPLSVGTSAYDHYTQDGYQNLSIWIQAAAFAAGR